MYIKHGKMKFTMHPPKAPPIENIGFAVGKNIASGTGIILLTTMITNLFKFVKFSFGLSSWKMILLQRGIADALNIG